jgi:hypothetical protein
MRGPPGALAKDFVESDLPRQRLAIMSARNHAYGTASTRRFDASTERLRQELVAREGRFGETCKLLMT